MKKFNLSCFLLIIGFTVSAQRQNLYFLKNNGQQVKIRDSADYLRIVKEPEQGSNLYVVNEHYLNGSTKSIGYSSKIDPPLYEGEYVSYYQNGKKSMVANYKNGKQVDIASQYYPNGNLYTTVVYSSAPDGKTLRYIKDVKDSIGKDLVIDGNGECVFYDGEFKSITERGSIKNGQYDGLWIGGSSTDKSTYKETYSDGKFVSGESIDQDGTVYQYTTMFIAPEFKGGMPQFYNYLKRTIRYPQECYREGIQGKVILSFTVMRDGSVEDLKVMNNVHPALAREAVRVVKASPAWVPASVKGRPANVRYNVPVSFTINK